MAETEVLEAWDLPRGVCSSCTKMAIAAIHFRTICLESAKQWSHITSCLSQIDTPNAEDKTYFIFYNKTDFLPILNVQKEVKTVPQAVSKLNQKPQPPSRDKKRTVRKFKSKSNGPRWKCKDCGKEFTLPSYLNQHLRMTMKRACTHCGKIVDREKLHQHLANAHDIHLYHCKSCHQLFQEEHELEEHIQTAHSVFSYVCHVCNNGFINDRALNAHMYAHTLFHCQSCSSSFENRRCYKYHISRCEGSKRPPESIYECHDCGNKYKKKESLRTHIEQKHLNVLPYICQKCGKRSSNLGHHRAHESIHMTERKVFQCYCGAKMLTQLGFNLHQRIHSGEKPYECSECGDRFLSSSRRLDHIKRRHVSTKDMPHGCEKCPAKFIRPSQLKKHYQIAHSMVEESLCPRGLCVTCTDIAINAFEFRVLVRNSRRMWSNCLDGLDGVTEFNDTPHSFYTIMRNDLSVLAANEFSGDSKSLVNRLSKKRAVVIEKKPRTARTGPNCDCTDCGKSFLSPYYLNVHLKNSGQKEACITCGAVVFRGLEMKEHLQKVHGENVHLCPDCPMLFTDDNQLKTHAKMAHRPGALTCGDCGRTFSRTASFEVHSQMHAVRTCRACGAQFTNRSCYREHRSKCEPDAKPDLKLVPRSRRSNIRDPATFICDHCGKIYHSRPQLKNHIVWIHMDVRPHQCQWCGKRFYTPTRLAEHSVVHTRERNFGCDICGAKLVSKMAAVYHRRRHTGEKPYECDECGEKFISSSRRSEHAKRRHGKGVRMQCMECPANFVRSHELRKHIDKTHKIHDAQFMVDVKG